MIEGVLRRAERCPSSLPLGRAGSLAEEEGRDRDGEEAAFDESCEQGYNRIFSHHRSCLLAGRRRA